MRAAVVVESGPGGDADVGESAVAIVVVENAGGAVAGNENVRPAIVVIVERGDAQGIMAVGLVDVGFFGDVFKGAVAVVVIENIFCSGQSLRAAHHGDAFPHTGGAIAGSRGGGEIEVHIVGDHEVEMAIAVVIDEGAAVAPGFAGASDARFFAYVGESAVAVVVIEDVFSVVGDVKIFPAVVVIVADAHALAPTGVREAGFLRDVGKGSVVIVVVEVARRSSLGGRCVESGAVDNEDVRPAIVVVIEDGDAGSGGLDDVFLGVDAAKNFDDVEACFFGDIGEMRERFGISFGEQGGAEEKRNGQKQREKSPRAFEREWRTMGQTGNHELLAY